MDDDTWAVSSSGSSRSYRSSTAPKYQSGAYLDSGDYEEEEEEEEEEEQEQEDDDDDIAEEYLCPFCSDEYDLVELCHHIDEEHQLEANNGICPVCNKRVMMHMVDHITTHHKDVLKSDQKQMEDPYSDKYFQSLLDEPPLSMNHHHTSKTVAPDPFLSFINNSPLKNQTKLVQPDSSVEDKNFIKDTSTEKDVKPLPPLSDSEQLEQLEKAKKCEYVQGLLSSAMFDDGDEFF